MNFIKTRGLLIGFSIMLINALYHVLVNPTTPAYIALAIGCFGVWNEVRIIENKNRVFPNKKKKRK